MTRSSLKRIAIFIPLGMAAVAGAAFVFAWSGVYNIAASRGHWFTTDWILTFGMRNSVKTHAWGIREPPLDDENLVVLGAGHFHNGCAFCHGAPGVPQSPVTLSMLPPPPDLSTQMRPWRDREIFWIVKHGIKYAGMPAWVAQSRDDEVWAMAAFLKRLPQLNADSYRKLALGPLRVSEQRGRDIATADTAAEVAGACARCHGGESSGPASNLVPILHGQRIEFLSGAMQAYASGARHSGIMQPIARELSAAAAGRVAAFYAALPPPRLGAPASTDAVTRGRALAEQGDPAAKVPSCIACHSEDALPSYPRLSGQNAGYLANRLRLWRNGLTNATDGDAIMAPIARNLSDEQIADLAAYFAIAHGAPSDGAGR